MHLRYNNYDKAAMLDFELREVRKSGGDLVAIGVPKQRHPGV